MWQAHVLLALTRLPTSRTDSGGWERWSLKSRCRQFLAEIARGVSPWFRHCGIISPLVCQTEEGAQGHDDLSQLPREGSLTLEGGLPPDDALQQQRQESIGGARREQELLWKLVGRYGGNDQNSVQVTREAQTAIRVLVCLLPDFIQRMPWFSALTEDKGHAMDPVGWRTR